MSHNHDHCNKLSTNKTTRFKSRISSSSSIRKEYPHLPEPKTVIHVTIKTLLVPYPINKNPCSIPLSILIVSHARIPHVKTICARPMITMNPRGNFSRYACPGYSIGARTVTGRMLILILDLMKTVLII